MKIKDIGGIEREGTLRFFLEIKKCIFRIEFEEKAIYTHFMNIQDIMVNMKFE